MGFPTLNRVIQRYFNTVYDRSGGCELAARIVTMRNYLWERGMEGRDLEDPFEAPPHHRFLEPGFSGGARVGGTMFHGWPGGWHGPGIETPVREIFPFEPMYLRSRHSSDELEGLSAQAVFDQVLDEDWEYPGLQRMLAEYDGLRGDSREQWSLSRVIVATRNQLWSDFVRMEEEGGVFPPAFRPSSYTGPGFYTQGFEP